MVYLLAAKPGVHPLSAPVDELDPHVGADDDEPLDLDFDRAVAREAGERNVVRSNETVAELECIPEETEDELRGGMVVELGRGWDPLESTCRHASLSIL